jgi:hypothetical protein
MFQSVSTVGERYSKADLIYLHTTLKLSTGDQLVTIGDLVYALIPYFLAIHKSKLGGVTLRFSNFIVISDKVYLLFGYT